MITLVTRAHRSPSAYLEAEVRRDVVSSSFTAAEDEHLVLVLDGLQEVVEPVTLELLVHDFDVLSNAVHGRQVQRTDVDLHGIVHVAVGQLPNAVWPGGAARLRSQVN